MLVGLLPLFVLLFFSLYFRLSIPAREKVRALVLLHGSLKAPLKCSSVALSACYTL